MSYADASFQEVTREEARREVLRHGADWQAFLMENGDRPTYIGSEVLDWLGY